MEIQTVREQGENDPTGSPESLLRFDETTLCDSAGQAVSKGQSDSKSTVRDILDAFLPPVPIEDGDGRFLRVSDEPATREDVVALQLLLDERLQIRQARETGICPVREELYSQTFDELIREIAIESPERGLMILRLRDEARMTIAAYQTLYNTSMGFGMRKAIQAERGLVEFQRAQSEKEVMKKRLQAEVEDLQNQCQETEKQYCEKRILLNKKRQDEKEFLKHQHAHLSQYLKQNSQQQEK
uniref:28 kDa inner dynein arm light chain, axonemal n=1 Tax=Hirondellea gigas TaxID=1518452 RepID=A0A6A7G9G3_9CRUS